MAKRKYSGSSYSPRYPVRLVSKFVPRSVQLRGLAGKAARYAGKGALRAIPYLGAAMTAYDVGSTAYNAYKSYNTPRTPPTVQRGQTQNMRRAGSVKTAHLSGKVYAKTKANRKLKKGKMSTRLGLQTDGVHSTEEHRFTTKTDQAVADRFETIQIGHASMPAKTVMMAVSRALIKHVLKRVVTIKNFNDACGNLALGYSIRMGDILRFEYYNYWLDSGAMSNFHLEVTATDTFESLAYRLSLELQTLANGVGNGKITSIRWQEFKYEPNPVYGDNFTYPFFCMCIKTFMCEIEIKSTLKVQNRTVNIVGDDDDADDVDNVPLVGMLYKLKGNNCVNKSNRRVLHGIGTGQRILNEVILFDGITRSNSILNNGADAVYNPVDTTFVKPSEPAKPYELVNCISSSKININPGGIKTSVLSQKFKLPLSVVLDLCCADGGNIRTDLKYNSKLGYTQVMHLEKVIGSNTSSVSVAAEVQYDIWCAVTSKAESKYTNTSAMQIDYGVYP